MSIAIPITMPDPRPANATESLADAPDTAVAAESAADPLPQAGPIDADWAQHERAAQGEPIHPPGEDDDPYGDPEPVMG